MLGRHTTLRLFIPLIFFAPCLALPAKKPVALSPEDQAFLGIKTFCIDMGESNSPQGDRYFRQASDYLKEDPKPEKKLGWKWAPDCAKTDATLHLLFDQSQRQTQGNWFGMEIITLLRLRGTLIATQSKKKLAEDTVEAEYSNVPRITDALLAKFAKRKQELLKVRGH